ncbi:hypothetical protein OEZ86_013527 [Tetradesmus obliquus]|nr:hypothetical protein OEZ86_013527 [Tetradesmus obliquus]
MGEQEDNPSAAVPHNDLQQQAKLDGQRRQRDAAEQHQATRRLHSIEAAALQANPEDAGHPERHRALSTEDYPAPEPPAMAAADSPTSSFMEPQIADGLPWLGINSSGININDSSIAGDDAALGDSPLGMLAAAATAAAAADAAASAAAAAAAAASAAADAGDVVGRAVEQVAQEQQQQGGGVSSSGGQQREVEGGVVGLNAGQGDGAKNDDSSLLEPWCEKP